MWAKLLFWCQSEPTLKYPIDLIHCWPGFRSWDRLIRPPPPDSASGFICCISSWNRHIFQSPGFHPSGFLFKADNILYAGWRLNTNHMHWSVYSLAKHPGDLSILGGGCQKTTQRVCPLLDKGAMQLNAVTKDKRQFLSRDRGTCLWYTDAACTGQWDKSLTVAAVGLLHASRTHAVRFNAVRASVQVSIKFSFIVFGCVPPVSTVNLILKWLLRNCLSDIACMHVLPRFLHLLHQISPERVLTQSIRCIQQPGCVCRVLLCCTCSYCLRGNVLSVYEHNPNYSSQDEQLADFRLHAWLNFYFTVITWAITVDQLLWQQVAGVHHGLTKPRN